MADSQWEYPEKLRKKLVGLARSGRSAESLGRQFEPSAQTIRNWVREADIEEGRIAGGLSKADRKEIRRLRRENRRLQMEREILEKARGLVRSENRGDILRIFEFVKANRSEYPVAMMCRLLEVSTSGFYQWDGRTPSARAVADAALLERIREIHRISKGRYGAPRIRAALAKSGWPVGRKRVARLMRANGLVGRGGSRRP